MKKNGICLLLACVIFALAAESLMGASLLENVLYGYSEQERLAAYRQLVELEQQKKAQKIAYVQAMQSALSDKEKTQLMDEYNKDMQELSQQITQQHQIIGSVASPQKKLFWQVAKVLGITGLLGLLAYRAFVAPSTVSLPVTSDLKLPQKEEGFELPESKKLDEIVDVAQEITDPTGATSGIRSLTDMLPSETKKLTPEEMALYQLRRKKLTVGSLIAYSTMAASSLIFGPMLPLDAWLLFVSASSAAGALHYHDKLNPGLIERPNPILLMPY